MPAESRGGAPREHSDVVAFAPGRVNLIGEHTDYNHGLALPFAIAQGITVQAQPSGDAFVYARALDLGEEDRFALGQHSLGQGNPAPGQHSLAQGRHTPGQHPLTQGRHTPGQFSSVQGWRAFVRGAIAELGRAGFPLVGAHLEIGSDLPQGSGLSSSAALEVALCLALLALAGGASFDRIELARLCARIENDWVGARTGLLDQLASLCGAPDTALCIDFRALTVEPVPLRLQGGWRLVILDSGQRHAHADSAYNERRAECALACELMGVPSLREASWDALERLPEPLRRRAAHVLGENARVQGATAALRAGDLGTVGHLLNASHASLRDYFEVSTAAVEAAVQRLLGAGAGGARLIGGGFGGHVLGLFAPGVSAPFDAREVRAGAGAHLL